MEFDSLEVGQGIVQVCMCVNHYINGLLRTHEITNSLVIEIEKRVVLFLIGNEFSQIAASTPSSTLDRVRQMLRTGRFRI